MDSRVIYATPASGRQTLHLGWQISPDILKRDTINMGHHPAIAKINTGT
jgi:hypothetical protein